MAMPVLNDPLVVQRKVNIIDESEGCFAAHAPRYFSRMILGVPSRTCYMLLVNDNIMVTLRYNTSLWCEMCEEAKIAWSVVDLTL